MNDNYGEVFRIIRTSQHLTLKEVSEGIVSLSFLGKFETGATNITLPIFIKLLDRLNIKMDEFIFFCNSTFYSFDCFIMQLTEAYRSHDMEQLLYLKEQENQRFQQTQRKEHQINSIIISAAMVDINPGYAISKADLKIISDYLVQVPFWSSYNLLVFSSSNGIISPYLLFTLIKEIIKSEDINRICFSNLRELIFLLHHSCTVFLRNDHLEQAIEICNYSKKLLKSGFFFEKNRNLFLSGLIEIFQGNTYTGLKKANDAIAVIQTLEPQLTDKYILELQRTLKKVSAL